MVLNKPLSFRPLALSYVHPPPPPPVLRRRRTLQRSGGLTACDGKHCTPMTARTSRPRGAFARFAWANAECVPPNSTIRAHLAVRRSHARPAVACGHALPQPTRSLAVARRHAHASQLTPS
eukprot:5727815-Prymnesium_polylepis.1